MRPRIPMPAGRPFSFTPDRRAAAERMISSYPSRRAALLPLLWLVQGQEGWISREAIRHAAGILGMTESEVVEAAGFYEMFRFEPACLHRVEACRGLTCAMRGAAGLLRRIEDISGARPGRPSEDGSMEVSEVECLGLCDSAPAVRVDGRPVSDEGGEGLEGAIGGISGWADRRGS